MDINRLFNIDGKTALITGGSRGIGEMIAAGFLANGVKVYITARKEAPLIEKAKELSEKFNGECIAIPCDLSNICLLYTSPSPRDISGSRMPSSA